MRGKVYFMYGSEGEETKEKDKKIFQNYVLLLHKYLRGIL